MPTLRLPVILTLLALASPALSQNARKTVDADQLRAARELMQVTGAAGQIERSIPVMVREMEEQLVQQYPACEKQLKDDVAQVAKRLSARKQELLDEIADLLVERFSAAEMREITVFYRTPVGAKYMRLQSEIVQRSALAGQRWGERIGRELDEEFAARPGSGACPAYGGQTRK
jgi:hypothetical protein